MSHFVGVDIFWIDLKVGLYHWPNQINEMNDSRGGRCFESPLKQERGHAET